MRLDQTVGLVSDLPQGETGGNDVPAPGPSTTSAGSPSRWHKIEGPTHRDGKHAPSYWTFAAGTVEEKNRSGTVGGGVEAPPESGTG